MDPVTSETVIDAPRERVFAFLQDLANHESFTDHYLVDWRLTRENPVGRGAGARFRVKIPGNRFSWADVTLVEVQPPRRIVEVGRSGKGNRVKLLAIYELFEAPGRTTRVRFTLETQPGALSDRLMEMLGGRAWIKSKSGRALRRLRSILEGAGAGAKRVTVAGR